ncbi:MAG TPA: hypothetical protein VK866_15470, partial [Acidimicrobiales bacterium]|nr:hypothetical protein [Acidimicrobiales bacterium]
MAGLTQAGPVALPDETAYLAVARWVAGQGEPLATGHHPGFGLLLAPFALVGVRGLDLHTAALVVNALLAGGAVLLTAALARALHPGASPWLARAAAALAVVFPALAVGARIAWPETTLTVMVLATAVLLARWARERSPLIDLRSAGAAARPGARATTTDDGSTTPRTVGPVGSPVDEIDLTDDATGTSAADADDDDDAADDDDSDRVGPAGGDLAPRQATPRTTTPEVGALVAAATVAGVAPAFHGRATALLLGVAAALVVVRPRRREVLAAGAGALAGLAVTALALALAYEGPPSGERAATVADAGSAVVATVAGQVVALAGSTLGLGVLGIVAGLAAALRWWRAGRTAPPLAPVVPVVGAALAVTALALLAISGVSLAGSDRADTFGYARYVEPLAVPLTVLAVASGALARRGLVGLAVAVTGLSGATVVLASPDVLRLPLRIMLLSTSWAWAIALDDLAFATVLLVGAGVLGLVGAHQLVVPASPAGPRHAARAGAVVLVAVAVLAVPGTILGQRHVDRLGDIAAGQVTGASLVAAELAETGADCVAHDVTDVPLYARSLYQLEVP